MHLITMSIVCLSTYVEWVEHERRHKRMGTEEGPQTHWAEPRHQNLKKHLLSETSTKGINFEIRPYLSEFRLPQEGT